MDLPEITEVERLEFRPGDRLIVHCGGYSLTESDVPRIKELVRTGLKLPPDTPVLVVDRNIRVSVAGAG